MRSTVTWRPSFSLAIFCSWLLAIGGTASQARTQRPRSTSSATIPRRTHLFFLKLCIEAAAFIRASVPQTDAKPETRKPGDATNVMSPGLMAGIRPIAIVSLDRKSMVPVVLAARDCRRDSSAVRPRLAP
ncbi:hypothetical protein [Variovorax sp.]|uniref:hypothetical protein n=1 Tax=Variovorax sp. TaxID=1871043 RepID=UPI0025D1D194|nr:hypothetical protein [Variovorax sp.]